MSSEAAGALWAGRLALTAFFLRVPDVSPESGRRGHDFPFLSVPVQLAIARGEGAPRGVRASALARGMDALVPISTLGCRKRKTAILFPLSVGPHGPSFHENRLLSTSQFGPFDFISMRDSSTHLSLEILKAAWDLGINTFDTANMYSNGESERIIGQFILQHKIPRENVVIITKIFCLVSPDVAIPVAFDPSMPNTRSYVNQGGLSRTAIFNQVDASLARLKTTYLDVLMIHAPDPTTPFEETMRALHDLVALGKVRYLGAANLAAWQLAEMNHVAEMKGWTQFTCMEVEHSLLDRAAEPEIFAYCEYKGIGVIAYRPLAQGHLARPLGTQSLRTQNAGAFGKTLRDSDKKIIERVQELAGKTQTQMSQVALAWSGSKVTSPIVGVNAPGRVRDAIVRDKILSSEDIAFLEELYE
ncbi:NADP-dependent oxidoreductase domain-containing protein [Mycena filopes]|nr:NADP-dependent oxidoreductase domain-containing protein [Mycena filopes]